MEIPHATNDTAPSLYEKERSAVLNMHPLDIITDPINVVASAQLDGGNDYYSRVASNTTGHLQPSAPVYPQQQFRAQAAHPTRNGPSMPPPPPHLPAGGGGIAVKNLLPYCTTEPPLNEAQVIALSDIVGNLKELVLLALGAASGAAGCMKRLEGAVGLQAAGNIADFFTDEWEIEG